MTGKAKRKLSDFDFDYEGAAVALVGPSVGGPANGHTTLLTKSVVDVSSEQIEKATEVKITMNIVDFLCKFFYMWHDDAVVLAMAMGYDVGEAGYSFVEAAEAEEEYLRKRVEAIEIMKSVTLDKSVDEIKKAVSELKPEDVLAIMRVQERFEKNLAEATAKAGQVVEKSTNKEDIMSSEFVTKAKHETLVSEAVEKAVAASKEELATANEIIKQYKEKEKEAVSKARLEKLKTVVSDAKAEELFKSLEKVDDASFDTIVASIVDVEKQSKLFTEEGGQGDGEAVQKDLNAVMVEKMKKQFGKV